MFKVIIKCHYAIFAMRQKEIENFSINLSKKVIESRSDILGKCLGIINNGT